MKEAWSLTALQASFMQSLLNILNRRIHTMGMEFIMGLIPPGRSLHEEIKNQIIR